jgi:transcriptional regulator with XRE-family HTH domain
MFSMVFRRRPSTPSTFRKQFIDRTRSLRVASGLTAQQVADELEVKLDTYGKWEKRALLPHHLIIPFCEITGADPWLLLTGTPFTLGKRLPGRESGRQN